MAKPLKIENCEGLFFVGGATPIQTYTWLLLVFKPEEIHVWGKKEIPETCRVLIFLSFSAAKGAANLAMAKTWKVTAGIVLDSPLYVGYMPGVIPLDIYNKGVSYIFKYIPLTVVQAKQVARHKTPLKLVTKEFDLLPQLIAEQQSSDLSGSFHAVLTLISDPLKKARLRGYLLNDLFEVTVSENVLKNEINKYDGVRRRPESQKFFDDTVEAYLGVLRNHGTEYRRALRAAKAQMLKSKTPNYKSLAKDLPDGSFFALGYLCKALQTHWSTQTDLIPVGKLLPEHTSIAERKDKMRKAQNRPERKKNRSLE